MIYVGADHRGFNLKKKLLAYFDVLEYEYFDIGNTIFNPDDDYPEMVVKLRGKMGLEDKAILICGSGVGVTIVANKLDGIRCGLGLNEAQVTAIREHDNVNCLALASDYITEDEAKGMVRTFLSTNFSGGDRYKKRLDEIAELEKIE